MSISKANSLATAKKRWRGSGQATFIWPVMDSSWKSVMATSRMPTRVKTMKLMRNQRARTSSRMSTVTPVLWHFAQLPKTEKKPTEHW
jgi:hypothetical protein